MLKELDELLAWIKQNFPEEQGYDHSVILAQLVTIQIEPGKK